MPLNWKLPKVFYGWWIVAASVVVAAYVAGAVFYGFTTVFEPIANELGWSYTQVSLAASLRGLEMGLLAPVVGILVDRWGPRRLIAGGVVSAALGLILLSRVNSLGMFYGAFVLITVGTSATTMTVLMTAVANWFQHKIGIASGIAISGFGLGGLLVPVMVKLIELYDWRMTIIIIALGMLAVILPLSLVFRHKPEQYGYLPDGQVEDTVADTVAAFNNNPKLQQATEVGLTTKQALRSGTFWRIALAFTVHVMLVSTVITHVMPYLSSIGVARSRSSLVATAIPVISIGGRLGLGWLGDKVNRKFLAAGAFASISVGMLCFGYISTTTIWLIIPFIIFFSIGYGGLNVQRPSLVREYFGRANFGTIFGLIIGVNMLGGIIGPTLAGWVYDTWGRYQGIWLALAGLPIAALISMLTIAPVRTVAQVTDKA
ncbi:MFS transporter [Chloroflexota bacterium]